MTATLEDAKLMSLTQFCDLLNTTEYMTSVTIPMDGTAGSVVFSLPPGWNVGLSDKDPQELTEATLAWAGGGTYQMTKEAILGASHAFGLSPAYVAKTPGVLIASHLNYWATHSPDVALKFLTKDDRMLAVTKDSIKPFSNVLLLEQAMEKVYDVFDLPGTLDDVMVDVKSHHDLHITNMRLVITNEDVGFSMEGSEDLWSPGLQIRNSLTGKHPLSVASYLYSWETHSGVVMPSAEGRYNRKFNGQEIEDVLTWTSQAAEHALSVVEHEMEILNNLGLENIHDAVGKVLADIFKTYKIPLKVRGDVMDHIIQTEDQTYYGVVNAVSQTANNAGLPEQFVTNVLEAAGEIAAHAHERCNSCQRVYV